ncbi:MAG: ribulose-phosphate 3-epimerase [Actinomycetota bacterium]|nr:ribulose-phosphate 3-epimerase [Actinomycetota bacterium]
MSLWSADLLAVGRAIDLVEPVADGFHLDVFDGHNVDDLLFGPDFAAAVRKRTSLPLDVHLNVTDPDHWARRFIDVGADIVTVQAGPCAEVEATLSSIREQGAAPSLGVELHESIDAACERAEFVDRYLLMGTPIGIKGIDPDPAAPSRVRYMKATLSARGAERPVFVDGGIRSSTVDALAAAGADGVIPGSLVFGDADPCAAIRRLHALTRRGEVNRSEIG